MFICVIGAWLPNLDMMNMNQIYVNVVVIKDIVMSVGDGKLCRYLKMKMEILIRLGVKE